MNILGEEIKFNDYKKALNYTNLWKMKKLNDEELTWITTVLTGQAKSRKKKLRSSTSVNGTKSPAYRRYKEQKWDVPTTREKQIEQIRQVKDFLNDKTSTVKGAQEYREQVRKTFNKKLGTNLSKSEFSKFGNIIDTLEDSYDWYSMQKQYDSEQLLTEISRITSKFEDKTDSEIVTILADNYTYNYEMTQWRNNGQTFEEPEVPETLKELYPKKWAEQQAKKEKEENSEDDEDNSNITKESFK